MVATIIGEACAYYIYIQAVNDYEDYKAFPSQFRGNSNTANPAQPMSEPVDDPGHCASSWFTSLMCLVFYFFGRYYEPLPQRATRMKQRYTAGLRCRLSSMTGGDFANVSSLSPSALHSSQALLS